MTFSSQNRILVFDIGGSHISCCSFLPSDSSTGDVQQATVADSCSLAEFLQTIMLLGKRALPDGEELGGASLAMPGPADYACGISYMKHKFQGLYGVSLAPELASCLDCPPDRISFLNDADAFLIGELNGGAAAGAQRAIGITLGTGIGSAFAVDGRLVVDGAGVPKGGEIWNHPYRGDIVENIISTASIQRSYECRTGLRAEVRSIAGRAASEPEAREIFEQFGLALGQVLREVCGEFRPECIVLGGGIAGSSSLFLPAAEQALEGLSIRICISKLGGYAPLVGAGVNWHRARSSQIHIPGSTQCAASNSLMASALSSRGKDTRSLRSDLNGDTAFAMNADNQSPCAIGRRRPDENVTSA
jgi:glucokinase